MEGCRAAYFWLNQAHWGGAIRPRLRSGRGVGFGSSSWQHFGGMWRPTRRFVRWGVQGTTRKEIWEADPSRLSLLSGRMATDGGSLEFLDMGILNQILRYAISYRVVRVSLVGITPAQCIGSWVRFRNLNLDSFTPHSTSQHSRLHGKPQVRTLRTSGYSFVRKEVALATRVGLGRTSDFRFAKRTSVKGGAWRCEEWFRFERGARRAKWITG